MGRLCRLLDSRLYLIIMEENYLSKSFLFLFLIIISLLALSFVPTQVWKSLHLKQVNMLADIKPTIEKPATQASKTDSIQLVIPSNKSISKKDSIANTQPIRIEDYSENKRALYHFFDALKSVRKQPVRIAFFGDSFIEGDILCGSFRDTLQQIYGGRGVGFVPITSEVAQFRTTIQHTFNNWETYSIVGHKNSTSPLGTSGFCFVPLEGNEVEYKPGRKRNTRPLPALRLFYVSHVNNQLQVHINDTLMLTRELNATDRLHEEVFYSKKMESIKLQFTSVDSLNVYGASFEDSVGVYVDNFSMRGNSGMGLFQISQQQNEEFNKLRDYKLIILQYGLNVVTESDTSGYQWYADKMIKVVNRLKEHFPEASILIVSVSDRSSNQNGKFETIPSLPLMRNKQREIASTTKVAFWDLYASMGGKNSMVKFTTATPPLAAKDYTHLTFLGGKKLAKQLADAILQERKHYGLGK